MMTIVVLSIAVVILKRILIFIYSIITSPFGVLGLGVPKGVGGIFAPFSSFASDWWKRLLKTAIYLPIYLLFIIILVNVSISISDALLMTKNITVAAGEPCDGRQIAASFIGIIVLIISLFVLSDWFKNNAPLVPPTGGVGGLIGSRIGQGLIMANIARRWSGREAKRAGKSLDDKTGGNVAGAKNRIDNVLQKAGNTKLGKAALLGGRSIRNVGGATIGALGGARGTFNKATSLQGSEGWIPPAKTETKTKSQSGSQTPQPKPNP